MFILKVPLEDVNFRHSKLNFKTVLITRENLLCIASAYDLIMINHTVFIHLIFIFFNNVKFFHEKVESVYLFLNENPYPFMPKTLGPKPNYDLNVRL